LILVMQTTLTLSIDRLGAGQLRVRKTD